MANPHITHTHVFMGYNPACVVIVDDIGHEGVMCGTNQGSAAMP
jgi:hypothetical protein